VQWLPAGSAAPATPEMAPTGVVFRLSPSQSISPDTCARAYLAAACRDAGCDRFRAAPGRNLINGSMAIRGCQYCWIVMAGITLCSLALTWRAAPPAAVVWQCSLWRCVSEVRRGLGGEVLPRLARPTFGRRLPIQAQASKDLLDHRPLQDRCTHVELLETRRLRRTPVGRMEPMKMRFGLTEQRAGLSRWNPKLAPNWGRRWP